MHIVAFDFTERLGFSAQNVDVPFSISHTTMPCPWILKIAHRFLVEETTFVDLSRPGIDSQSEWYNLEHRGLAVIINAVIITGATH
jgi:hypothetical protein